MASDWVAILAAAATGGLGATWLQQRWAVKTERRIRRDLEREDALKSLVARCDEVERTVDHMLSPEVLSPEGVFSTGTMMSLDQYVVQVESVWRVGAAPFIPSAEDLVVAVRASLDEAHRALGTTNPPTPEFFSALESVRTSATQLRIAVQGEITRPQWRFR
jgi:hypothetical protein